MLMGYETLNKGRQVGKNSDCFTLRSPFSGPQRYATHPGSPVLLRQSTLHGHEKTEEEPHYGAGIMYN